MIRNDIMFIYYGVYSQIQITCRKNCQPWMDPRGVCWLARAVRPSRQTAGAQMAKVVKAGSDVLIEAIRTHSTPKLMFTGLQWQRPVRVPVPIPAHYNHHVAIKPGLWSDGRWWPGGLLPREHMAPRCAMGRRSCYLCECFSDTHHPHKTCCRPSLPFQEVIFPHGCIL